MNYVVDLHNKYKACVKVKAEAEKAINESKKDE